MSRCHSTAVISVVLVLLSASMSGQKPAIGNDGLLTFDGKPTTLRELAVEFKKQRNFVLKFPDQLANRRVQMAAQGSTVRQVLDALCDVEKWTWTSSSDGSGATIEAPFASVRPGETVFAALKRVMPPDLVNYFGMPAVDKFSSGGETNPENSARQAETRTRLIGILRAREKELEGPGIVLSSMKPPDSELVVLDLLLSRVGTLSDELFNNADFQRLNPQETKVWLDKGTILLFECHFGPGSGTSFGANLAVP